MRVIGVLVGTLCGLAVVFIVAALIRGIIGYLIGVALGVLAGYGVVLAFDKYRWTAVIIAGSIVAVFALWKLLLYVVIELLETPTCTRWRDKRLEKKRGREAIGQEKEKAD